ncbi:hypothetical protein RN001_008538 [Aquatica leii]|uniref:Kinesin-like protein n=1 Tax=Aquatica leii TaxID=1421715 RepID=A0AAN7P9R7_9COLE|nr:hypothetical protein RN001_008538 [Aquatica leii]
MSSSSNTPKRNIATPLRLIKRKQSKLLPETPECFTHVTVETPSSSKVTLLNNDKCDEARNLIVAVRIRPMNARELSVVGAKNVITVDENKVSINSSCIGSSTTKLNYMFPYDHVFWSCDKSKFNYSSQDEVFSKIGNPLLENAFQGYNACLFAYGQTGSGKSYSMMGIDSENLDCNDIGIIPRFCKKLFNKIELLDDPNAAIVDVSYFEIYNEKIHDLLLSNSHRTPLKVREHPVWGPYVVNLSTYKVKSYEELKSWLLLGNKNRAVAATLMNEKSSRSHSIFSIELSLEENHIENVTKRSKISLVDLAGSERLGNTNNNSNEEKLKQGVFINKSLLTLGKVICALADQKKGVQFVPYRESVLTWLLRESLGGNSFTSMLATITPANVHIDETLATLRYACQARSIVNRAHVNEDPHERIIRELRVEVGRLQALRQDYERQSLSSSTIQIDSSIDYVHELDELRNQLTNKEKELEQAQQSWENRYKEHQLYQMEQLAEVEKKKEELESQIRIMSNLQNDVKLSPYRSNFLEEVENILKVSSSKEELLNQFEVWVAKCGYDYDVTLSKCGRYMRIVDNDSLKKANCPLNEVEVVTMRGEIQDLQNLINNLNWVTEECITDLDVSSVINDIYKAAKLLQPHISKEEKLRLAFAKFIKSTQVLETALLNNVNTKSKKVVTFRL